MFTVTLQARISYSRMLFNPVIESVLSNESKQAHHSKISVNTGSVLVYFSMFFDRGIEEQKETYS